jgi:hypothetical protein
MMGIGIRLVKKEYVEGPKAKQNFERAMTVLFRAKKIKKKPKKGKD